MKSVLALTACCCLLASPASAGSETSYIWRGWPSTTTDYMIDHGMPKDTTDNDFYLVCHGGENRVELDIRALKSAGYGDGIASDPPTTFVFGTKRIPLHAQLLGPSEMLGGSDIEYSLERDSPVLAAMERGAAFKIVLPKLTTQLFSPAGAKTFFEDMNRRCEA